ncbi:MAG: hypothetical protein AAF480_14525 [Actinomycetota bacterium]
MNTTEQTTKTPAAKQVGLIFTLLAAIFATLIALAPTAAAEPADELHILELDDRDPRLPEIPQPEILLLDPEILDELPWLFMLTADAEIDCSDNGAIDVEIGNKTGSFTMLEVLIDDIVVANPVVGPDMAWIDTFPAAAENSTVNVKVEAATTVLDVDLDVDCLAPDPWFEFIPNCDLGQAWVELGNHGPDEAMMGVHYDDLPHAPGLVLPGTSSVQPLAVNPNEFVGFAIEVDGEPIHTDGFFFDCPIPEPEPQPEPEEEGGDEDIDNTDGEDEDQGGKPDADQTDGDTDGGQVPDAGTEPTDETVETTDEVEGTDEIAVGTDEIALAGGLETDAGSTSNAILVALLLTFGVVMVVGSVAAMKLRR